MQPAARDAFRRLLAKGWMDAARQLHPAERMYTYWVNDNAFRQNKGMRLDFLLLSAPLQGVVTAAVWIPRTAEAGCAASYDLRGQPKPRACRSRLGTRRPVAIVSRPWSPGRTGHTAR
jgi:hypothetical protein